LDREINEKYELIIEGRDHGLSQAKINRTKIAIEILDENYLLIHMNMEK
ncbi:unnamed protein product, partial [Rotaria sordida]